MKPIVSVVIPAFNSAGTVQATIASVTAQTMEDFEVLVVNDGSTDLTPTVARSNTDPRVRVIDRPNGGVSAARNTGIEAARGKYVAFVDADDLWLPRKLECQLAYLERHPGVRAVHAGSLFVDAELRLTQVRPCEASEDVLLDSLLFRNMPHNMGTLVVERSMFRKMGMFDTSLAILEEWDMHIKCARNCNLVGIHEPLAVYRQHAGSRSRDFKIHVDPGLRVLDRIFSDPELPDHVRLRKREVYARFYTMLAGGAYRVGSWRDCRYWAGRAIRADPRTAAYMFGLPARRLTRRASITSPGSAVFQNQLAELRARVGAMSGAQTI